MRNADAIRERNGEAARRDAMVADAHRPLSRGRPLRALVRGWAGVLGSQEVRPGDTIDLGKSWFPAGKLRQLRDRDAPILEPHPEYPTELDSRAD